MKSLMKMQPCGFMVVGLVSVLVVSVFLRLKLCEAGNVSYHLSDLELKSNNLNEMLERVRLFLAKTTEYQLDDNLEQLDSIEIFRVLSQWQENNISSTKFTDLRDTLYYLDSFYRNSVNCFQSPSYPAHIKNQWIRNIAIEPTKYKAALSYLIEVFSDHAHPSQKGRTLLDLKMPKHSICNTRRSIQMDMNIFFHYAATLVMQHFRLAFFVFQSLYHHLKTKNEHQRAREIHRNMIPVLETLKNLFGFIYGERPDVLTSAPSDVRRCDPMLHVEHMTYERITHLMQGFVGSEDFLDPTDVCDKKCSFQHVSFYNRLTHSEKLYLGGGDVYDCGPAPSISRLYKQDEPYSDERLYHHLSFEKPSGFLQLYGRKYVSPGVTLTNFTTDDLRNWKKSRTKILGHCKICLCYIDRDQVQNATRTISGSRVIVPEGRIVTGIRWVIKNHVLRLEVQGTVYANRTLRKSTKRWYTEEDTEKHSKGNSSRYDSGVIHLSARNRSVCLDSVQVPDGMFVRGVRFILRRGLICLSVLSGGVDGDGNLRRDKEFWYSTVEHFPNTSRLELKLNEVDSSEYAPTGIYGANMDLSVSGNFFMKFQATSFDKDAAQTTVPFLDIQEVTLDPLSPIKGVGIYYKGLEGFGGFFGLKLLTANPFGHIRINQANFQNEFKRIQSLFDQIKSL